MTFDRARGQAAFMSPGEGLAWMAAVVLALSPFLGWYSGSIGGLQLSVIGWDTGLVGKLVLLVGLATIVLLVLRATGVELPPSVPLGMVIAGLGAFATVLVLVRLLAVPDDYVELGRSIGIWISLVAALLLIVAGLLKSAEEV
jgi:hypothetical protein